jgi:hypothetical protein
MPGGVLELHRPMGQTSPEGFGVFIRAIVG